MVVWFLLARVRLALARLGCYESIHMTHELERTIRREWAWRKKGR